MFNYMTTFGDLVCGGRRAPTADELIAMINEANRRFPKSELPVAVRARGSVLLPLMTYAAKKLGPISSPLAGLPVRFDSTLELNTYAIEYADGDEELYRGNELICRRPIERGAP